MTLGKLLERWAGIASADIMSLLLRAGDAFPEIKPITDKLTAALSMSLSPENLAAIAGILFSEAQDVLQGKFSGKPHTQDL